MGLTPSVRPRSSIQGLHGSRSVVRDERGLRNIWPCDRSGACRRAKRLFPVNSWLPCSQPAARPPRIYTPMLRLPVPAVAFAVSR